jgi:transposase-like protein
MSGRRWRRWRGRLPAALTLRAGIVLACERQPSNQVVAGELGIGPHTVGKWRNRFITDRLPGLSDELRRGRPRTIEDEVVAELVAKTLDQTRKKLIVAQRQITCPEASRAMPSGNVAINPRRASAKSRRPSNGSALLTAAFAVRVAGFASFSGILATIIFSTASAFSDHPSPRRPPRWFSPRSIQAAVSTASPA